MRFKIFLSVLVSIFVCLTAVSAFWPFDGGITGSAIDNTNLEDSNICRDSDDGIFSNSAGATGRVYARSVKYVTDKCRGKKKVREYYCNERTGRRKGKTIKCPGGCVSEEIEIEGKTYTAGKCVPLNPSCEEIDGGVKDEAGRKHRNRCGKGVDRNTFTTYSCNAGQTAVLADIEDCSLLENGRCTSGGCAGDCVDSDAEDDKDAAGSVTVTKGGEEKTYLDVCGEAGLRVKQYKCSNGKEKVVKVGSSPWVSCGQDRVCVTDEATGAGYCQSKGTAGETITLKGLRRIVQSLQDRIAVLEEAVSNLGSSA